ASATVEGSASQINEATVRCWSGQVRPKVPSTTWRRKRPSWTRSDWSRSMQARMAAASAGLAPATAQFPQGAAGARVDGALPEQVLDGVAGDQVDEQEDEEGDAEDGDQARQQATTKEGAAHLL